MAAASPSADVPLPAMPPPRFTPSDAQREESYAKKAEAADLLGAGNLDGALEAMTAALMLNPSPLTHAKRGAILLKLNRPTAAIKDCDVALKRNPDSAKSLKVRGRGACGQREGILWRKRQAQAPRHALLNLTPLRTAHTHTPSPPAAYYMLEDWEKANADFSRAMRCDPDPEIAVLAKEVTEKVREIKAGKTKQRLADEEERKQEELEAARRYYNVDARDAHAAEERTRKATHPEGEAAGASASASAEASASASAEASPAPEAEPETNAEDID